MSEKEYPMVRVRNSEYREELVRGEGARESAVRGNAYGTVVQYNEANLKNIPVICGHGGSMWLCPECAERIVQESREVLPDRPSPNQIREG